MIILFGGKFIENMRADRGWQEMKLEKQLGPLIEDLKC